MAGIREQKKNETRKAIINAAVCLFAEKGVEQTSMEELARAAGIGKATIYGYFATKNEIFLAYCEEEVAYAFSILEKKQDEDAPLTEQLVGLLIGQLTYVTANREFGRLFAREMMFPGDLTAMASRDIDLQYMTRLMEVLGRGQSRGELPVDCDLLLMMGHLHALYLFSLSQFYQGGVVNLDEAEVLLRALVLQTLNGPTALIHTDPAEAERWAEQKQKFLQRRNMEF
jgi:AcrR family transcriptional regulator